MNHKHAVERLGEIAKKNGYDPHACVGKLALIEGGFGVSAVRTCIDNVLKEGAVEVAEVLAEYLIDDPRGSYQKLGKSIQKKIQKMDGPSQKTRSRLTWLPGALTTAKDLEVLNAIAALNLQYDKDVARADPHLAAQSMVAEALNILSAEFPSRLLQAEIDRVRQRLLADGNAHSEDDVRRYMLSDKAFLTLLAIMTMHVRFAIDFRAYDTTVADAKHDDSTIPSPSGEVFQDQVEAALKVGHQAGVTPSGMFAFMLLRCMQDAIKHGAHRESLLSHIMQAADILFSRKIPS